MLCASPPSPPLGLHVVSFFFSLTLVALVILEGISSQLIVSQISGKRPVLLCSLLRMREQPWLKSGSQTMGVCFA